LTDHSTPPESVEGDPALSSVVDDSGDHSTDVGTPKGPTTSWWNSVTARLTGTWARFRGVKAFRLIAIGVVVFVAVAAGLAIYLPWEFSKVALPDVSKLTLAEAKAQLADLGIHLAVHVNHRPDSRLEDFWAVSAQDPTPGTRVLPNSRVSLSGHLVEVTVPIANTLTSVSKAEGILATDGLSGAVRYAYIDGSKLPGIESVQPSALSKFLDDAGIHGSPRSDGIPFPVTVDATFLLSSMANVVIPSDVAGTKVTAGSTVGLVLVPPIAIVPQLVGKSVADARATLKSDFLTGNFGTSQDWYSVQSQSTAAGSPFMIGSGALSITAVPDFGAFPALDGATWAQIIKNPDGYVGTRAILYGKVVQFDVNTGTCAFRMNTGPAQTRYSFDYDQNTYVEAGAANCALLGPIVQNDHLRIWVTVTGSHTYSTTIGGSATALELDIWRFDELPRQTY